MQNRVWAEIHASAAQHNLHVVRKLAPNAKIMAVFKADAYGHGHRFIFSVLGSAVDAIAVATMEEGVRIRQLGAKRPIICLSGLIDSSQLRLCTEHDITPTFYHAEQLQWLKAYSGQVADCWVKINTGMNRLGFELSQVNNAVKQATEHTLGEVGIMSHFANADAPNDPHNAFQLSQFIDATREFDGLRYSMANSAAVLSMPESHYDWIRPGVMLYGASPFANKTAKDLGLKAVMHLKSSVISIHKINAGERIGYGGIWTPSQTTRVGIISAGYADGYPRDVDKQAYVLIRDQQAPIIGRVSMDTLAVDLSVVQGCEFGDDVELWGEDLSVDLVAKWAGTISHELLCRVGPRVTRVDVD